MSFLIEEMVRFTSGKDFIIGEVEEIRRGHKGDHLLVVRVGNRWSGEKHIVLSSYAELVK